MAAVYGPAARMLRTVTTPGPRATADDASPPTADLDAPIQWGVVAGLFRRFLGFGIRAFGGPTAQIDMLRRELVDRDRWVEPARFSRTLGVYQALPGPEATELCVYFGSLRAGPLGGLVAGLGFVLPGLVLSLAAAALYVWMGRTPDMAGFLIGAQAAAIGAMLVACARLAASTTRLDPWLLAVFAAALMGSLAGIHFAVILAVGGAAAALVARGEWWFGLAIAGGLALAAGMYLLMVALRASAGSVEPSVAAEWARALDPASPLQAGWWGLKAGVLSFGGAASALPILHHDAVTAARTIGPEQFRDAVAVIAVLPAPAVMVAAFVGTVSGGWSAGLLCAVAILSPAFIITLAGHQKLERLTADPRLHGVFDGLACAGVGLAAALAFQLLPQVFEGLTASGRAVALLAVAVSAIASVRRPVLSPVVIVGSGLLFLLFTRL